MTNITCILQIGKQLRGTNILPKAYILLKEWFSWGLLTKLLNVKKKKKKGQLFLQIYTLRAKIA